MDFTVTCDGGDELEFFAVLPPELLHYRVLPVVYTASGRWGTVIFQALVTDDFSVWYARYFIKAPTCLHIRSAMETRKLHMAFKNHLNMEPAGWDRIQLKEEQFDFSYFPVIDVKLRFEPGEYAGFDINYSKTYLQRFIPHLGSLQAFLQNTDGGIGCHLCATPLYASPQMLAVIKNMLQFKYTDALGLIYIESGVLALLTLAIREMGREKRRPSILTKADMIRMEKLRDWLLENLYAPGSLCAIARRFAINEFKLKRDFKAAFGVSVFNFLLRVRMERAEKLLLETDEPIAGIAYMVGYSNGAHFSDAFKKRFGYSPNQLRKHS